MSRVSLPGSSLGREYFNFDNNLLGRLWGREDNSALEMFTVTANWPDSKKLQYYNKQTLKKKKLYLPSSFLSAFLYCILKRKASRMAATTIVKTTKVKR